MTDLEDVDEDIFGDDVEKRELSRVHKIKLAPLQVINSMHLMIALLWFLGLHSWRREPRMQDGTTLELQRMEVSKNNPH
eukprot:SAG31_NODE_1007_length_10425_cov_4.852799_7_plen_79_part_00